MQHNDVTTNKQKVVDRIESYLLYRANRPPKQVLLHREDFVLFTSQEIEKLEGKFGLPINPLGASNKWLKLNQVLHRTSGDNAQ